jgi:hypothetical protein
VLKSPLRPAASSLASHALGLAQWQETPDANPEDRSAEVTKKPRREHVADFAHISLVAEDAPSDRCVLSENVASSQGVARLRRSETGMPRSNVSVEESRFQQRINNGCNPLVDEIRRQPAVPSLTL